MSASTRISRCELYRKCSWLQLLFFYEWFSSHFALQMHTLQSLSQLSHFVNSIPMTSSSLISFSKALISFKSGTIVRRVTLHPMFSLKRNEWQFFYLDGREWNPFEKRSTLTEIIRFIYFWIAFWMTNPFQTFLHLISVCNVHLLQKTANIFHWTSPCVMWLVTPESDIHSINSFSTPKVQFPLSFYTYYVYEVYVYQVPNKDKNLITISFFST